MSDIKIVYNWIGPRGPIPNTEVPNLLNISSVLEDVQTSTHKFWADNIWPLIFCNQPNFDISSATYIDHKDKFVYPFTLTWRIPFTTYFYNDCGLLEYGYTPGHVKHLVRAHNGYFLIDASAEAWVENSHLTAMHSYFEFHQIPMNKIIYLTGCMNANTLYDKWIQSKGYNHPTQKMNIISFPVSQDALAIYFTAYSPKVPEYDVEKIPEKLFLSWNRRFRDHRIAIALGLDKLGLVDRSYMSMGKTDPENVNITVDGSFNPYYLADMEVSQSDVDNFKNKLPLVLDGETDTVRMCQDFDDVNRPYYQNSLVSIVTETNFNANEVTLTEKSFKPSKEKHPFIIVGAPESVKAFRDMGFRTFNEFWDENYDNIPDPRQRMKAILDVLKYIGSWNEDQIRDFRRRVVHVLNHNYETLKIRYSKIVADKIRTLILSQDKG
jgi:hypothetical protein